VVRDAKITQKFEREKRQGLGVTAPRRNGMPLSATSGRLSTKGRLVVPRFRQQLDDRGQPLSTFQPHVD